MISGKESLPQKCNNSLNSTDFIIPMMQNTVHSLATAAENAGLNKTPDGEGYFGFNVPRGAYIEVISYDKLVKDAKKRNQVLFDKLFRPKADQLIVLTGNE